MPGRAESTCCGREGTCCRRRDPSSAGRADAILAILANRSRRTGDEGRSGPAWCGTAGTASAMAGAPRHLTRFGQARTERRRRLPPWIAIVDCHRGMPSCRCIPQKTGKRTSPIPGFPGFACLRGRDGRRQSLLCRDVRHRLGARARHLSPSCSCRNRRAPWCREAELQTHARQIGGRGRSWKGCRLELAGSPSFVFCVLWKTSWPIGKQRT